jgi:glucan-binding YG repeat protein
MIKRSKKIIASLLMALTLVSVLPCTQTFATSEEGKKVSRQVVTVNGKDRLEILTSGKDKSQYVLNGEVLRNQWYEFDYQLLNIDKDGKKTLENHHSKIYLDENGYALSGWQVIDGEKYYMGAKGAQTVKGESGKYEKYLFDDDGKLITDKPVKLKYSDKAYTVSDDEKSVMLEADGVKYNVPKDESLANDSIVEKDGKYYYAARDMNYTGVYHIKKSSECNDYYAKEDGTLAKNEWVYVKKTPVLNASTNKYVDISAWKYYGQDMKNVKGYQTIDGKKYYFISTGSLKTGWKTGGNLGLEKYTNQDLVKGNYNWYYLGEGGAIKEGWINYQGNWYYIYSDGLMAKDTTTPDGYYVNKKGVYVQ